MCQVVMDTFGQWVRSMWIWYVKKEKKPRVSGVSVLWYAHITLSCSITLYDCIKCHEMPYLTSLPACWSVLCICWFVCLLLGLRGASMALWVTASAGQWPKSLSPMLLLRIQVQLMSAPSPAVRGKLSRQPANSCGFLPADCSVSSHHNAGLHCIL